MIKLIVTDVDGTLLDNNSALPKLNRRALLECKKRNIGVILATGKSIFAVAKHIKTLDLVLPQITLNGAVVVDNKQDIIYSIKIEPGQYFEVIKTIKEKGHKPLAAMTDGNIYYDDYDSNFDVFIKVHEPLYRVEKLEDPVLAQDCVSVGAAIKETDPLDAFLRKKYSKILQIVRSGEYFFDILNLGATKGNALRYICEKLNIKREEVAVFGDSPNDLSMFDYGALRIAVKNSFPEILKKADIITDENYKSGLGKAIYKYILAQNKY